MTNARRSSYYVDTNVLSRCLQPAGVWTASALVELRRVISARLKEGDLIVCGGWHQLEEGSRIPDLVFRRQFFDWYWSVIQWAMLMPTDELTLEEAASGRPLERNEPYQFFRRRHELRQHCRNDEKLSDIGGIVRGKVESFFEAQRSRVVNVSNRLRDQFSGLSPEEATRRWWRDAKNDVDDWVRDYMRNSHEHLGLPADEALWPPPRALQTAWAMHAFFMTKMFLNLGEGRRIDQGDMYDAHHYAGACYADVLVTDDRGFRATLRHVPGRSIEVVDFDEWVARLGASAR